MIDWVSIVRHSRRRFSNYMYAMPNKVIKCRKGPGFGGGARNRAKHHFTPGSASSSSRAQFQQSSSQTYAWKISDVSGTEGGTRGGNIPAVGFGSPSWG
ncbi:unnamed protein product [Bemisia tabaci]|uniref:Uncharacterized protein n=1 Tax=Bemisia tabaci TaxID=7038 RepID=A0A9P0EYQ2_BEMTA|nr:unnamed protein product [Bemisia tabaci]